jgi:hypothetical protein
MNLADADAQCIAVIKRSLTCVMAMEGISLRLRRPDRLRVRTFLASEGRRRSYLDWLEGKVSSDISGWEGSMGTHHLDM